MRENERLDSCFFRYTADIFDWRLIDFHVRHVIVETDGRPFGNAIVDVRFDRRHVHRLMYEDVRALGQPCHNLDWCGVTRKGDRAVMEIEPVRQRRPYRRVLNNGSTYF